MIIKIISGGQTGADQGGWEAADLLGLEKSGWMPKGYRTETGSRPDFTWALEHKDWEYPPRTELNIIGSDGTIIFGSLKERGSQLTRSLCIKLNKPCFVCPYPEVKTSLRGKVFIQWLKDNQIEVLNVAGNRESKNPGIQAFVKEWLANQLKLL